MSQEAYTLKVNDAFKKNRPIWVSVLVFIWVICAIVYWADDRSEKWFHFLVPVVYTLAPLLIIFFNRKDVYEISDDRIELKRGPKILRSIESSNIEGFANTTPVRLKVEGRRDFVFYGIINKSSRQKLVSVLREMGLRELPKPPKFTPFQIMILIGAYICTSHFLVSLLIWIICSIEEYKNHPWLEIDWFMFLHSIPVFVLFGASILTVVLVIKRNRKAGPVLPLTIILAVACCVFDIHNQYYNGSDKPQYFTWWWYGLFEPEKEYSPGEYNRCQYGYIDKSGKMVIEPQFDTADEFSEGMAKIGVRYEIDPNKRPTDPMFEAISLFDDDFFKYGYKYGYMNNKGEILIEPVYDDASAFSEGLACVAIDDKYGYINPTGEFVIEPVFENAWSFREGRGKIEIEDKYGYIDQTGNIVIKPQFSLSGYFSEGLAPVKIDGKYGFINKAGQMIIEPKFDSASIFSEGLAPIRIGRKFGFIDVTGQIVIEPQFDFAFHFSEGLAAVDVDMRDNIDKRGYINQKGQMIIEPKYSGAWPFKEGIANVYTEKGWGYRHSIKRQCLDKEGTVIARPHFDEVRKFNEGMSLIWIDGQYGYIDKTGTIVIEPQFDEADPFFEGLAAVGMKVDNEPDK